MELTEHLDWLTYALNLQRGAATVDPSAAIAVVEHRGEIALRFDLDFDGASEKSCINTHPEQGDNLQHSYRYAYRQYLPASLSVIGRTVLAQWHGTKDPGDERGLQPLSTRIVDGRFEIVTGYDPEPISTQGSAQSHVAEIVYSDPVLLGRWRDYVVDVEWDYRAGHGSLTILQDGIVIVDRRGPIGFNDTYGPGWMIGIYRSKGEQPFPHVTAYFSNLLRERIQ